jgi:hypothetical protein
MKRDQQGLYEVDCADYIETYRLQLDVERDISKTGYRSNALSGEMIFLGRSDVNEERSFAGISSFFRRARF